jgi:hypothetical protein
LSDGVTTNSYLPFVRRVSRALALTSGMVALALLVLPQPALADGGPPRLAAGPSAVLQGVLRKTMLRVEVARVQIRVDEPTQRKLAELASGRQSSKALDDGIVRAVMGTSSAVITSELRRDVPFDKYSESVYDDLESARESGLIAKDSYWALVRLLPEWFRALQDRGARKGDRFMCRIQPGSMRVVYRTVEGATLVDREVRGAGLGHAVLGSYLAPESDFREELLHSVFK